MLDGLTTFVWLFPGLQVQDCS